MALSPEQAKAAMDAGFLSPETYTRVLGTAKQAQTVPGLASAPTPQEIQAVPNTTLSVGQAMGRLGSGISNVASGISNALTDDATLEAQGVIPAPATVAPSIQPAVTDADVSEAATMQPTTAPAAPSIQAMPQANTTTYDNAVGGILNAAALGDKKAAELESYTKAFESKRLADTKKTEEDFNAQQKIVEDKLTALDTKLDDISKSKIDPNRIFSNMSFGQKLGTAILATLGGKGGIEKLDSMIKRDIAAQEGDIKNTTDILKQKSGLYKDFMDVYKDKISVKNSLAASMYQAAQLKAEGLAAVTKNAQVKASLLEKAAELEGKKEEYKGEVAKRQKLLAAEQTLAAVDPVTAKITQLPAAAQKPLLEAKEVYDATKAAFSTIDGIFEEAKGIGAIKGNVPFSDAKARVQANNANIESAIRATMKGQGTIQESEIERLVKPLLPLPSDSKSVIDIKKQKLKQLLETKNAGQIGRLSNMGLLSSGSLKSPEDKIKPRQ